MSKKSFYFPHDYNARNDEKILALRMDLKAEGYGIYFMLLEKLLESDRYILLKDYNRLAFDLRVSAENIKKVVENYGLFQFTEDGKLFYSESLRLRMQPLDNLRKQRSEAGKKSAEERQRVRGGMRPLQENPTTVERPLQKNSTDIVKESKVNNNVLLEKEPKEREYIGEENFSEEENSEPKQTAETSKKSSAKKRFQIPTPEQVQKYCDERQNGLTGKEFCDFYQSKDWMIGKNKMVDWQAAVRTWENKRKTQQKKQNNGNNNTKPTTPNSTGKISARSFLAKKLAGQTARDNQSGNITIEAEIIK